MCSVGEGPRNTPMRNEIPMAVVIIRKKILMSTACVFLTSFVANDDALMMSWIEAITFGRFGTVPVSALSLSTVNSMYYW
jgi:hypothetical protein